MGFVANYSMRLRHVEAKDTSNSVKEKNALPELYQFVHNHKSM